MTTTVFQNKELQDRLDYLMENQPKTNVETRDTGVGCDLPYRYSLFMLVHRKLFHNVPYWCCISKPLC